MNTMTVILALRFLALSVFTIAFCFKVNAASEETPPNVVLIFADDLGYGDIGCYGAKLLRTPNIDALAAEGRRFSDAHSASAVCTPSRYALMTGEYPHRKDISAPVFLKSGLIIDTEKQTVADVMKEAGYATAIIGKWHLGFGEGTPDWNGELKPGPLELGFDYYYGVPVVNSHPPFVYVENHHVVGLVPEDPFVYDQTAKTKVIHEKMRLNEIGGADAAHALYDDYAVGTHLTEKAVNWIGAQKDNPFFLILSTTNIHHPFTPAPRFQGTSECGLYGDFVHELDWIVGQVMDTLEEHGVADNTLVIFTSDNGGMFNATGQKAWTAGHELNGELFGFKFDAWEGGHRVPFIARWPGKIEAGSISEQLVSNIDMIATFAALTNGTIKEGQARDSVNVLSALMGDPVAPLHDHLVLTPFKSSHLSIRKGKWMYIGAQAGGGFADRTPGSHGFGGPPAIQFAGRENSDMENGNIKADAPSAQLYDLENDLAQSTNVYNQYPEVVEEMKSLLRFHRQEAKSE
jgi:arylsulfatase A